MSINIFEIMINAKITSITFNITMELLMDFYYNIVVLLFNLILIYCI